MGGRLPLNRVLVSVLAANVLVAVLGPAFLCTIPWTRDAAGRAALIGFGTVCLVLVAAPRIPAAGRAAACAFVASVVGAVTTFLATPEALVPARGSFWEGLGWVFLGWSGCGLLAGLAGAGAVATERRRTQLAAGATIAMVAVVVAARWSAGPFDSATEQLAAIVPDSIVESDGAPVRVTDGLEVVLGCRDLLWCENGDYVVRHREGDAGGHYRWPAAIARVEGHWIVARGREAPVPWSSGTAFDADSLEPVALGPGALGGAYALPHEAGARAVGCALVALAAMLGSLPLMRRARRLGRAFDLTIDEHGGATTSADASVRLARPVPSGDAYAWSLDPAVAAYRDDAHPVVDAVPGSRAEALGQAADRAVALQVLALGAIATGFGVMAFAPNHSFVWPF